MSHDCVCLADDLAAQRLTKRQAGASAQQDGGQAYTG
jgi:hypothetical protein